MKLGNRVTTEITKYKGLGEEFQHKFRETLTFAIPKKGDSSQFSSANTSMNRRRNQVNRMHGHIRPSKVGWEDELEVILKMQEEFIIWRKEVTRTSGHDPEYEWNSLMSLLDKDWSKRMKEDRTLKDKPQKECFKKMKKKKRFYSVRKIGLK